MPTLQRRNEAFQCIFCHKDVPSAHGASRNHCPFCLTSLHVDEKNPGDRSSTCGGIMHIDSVRPSKHGSYQIHFVCEVCKKEHWNMMATDDTMEPLGAIIAQMNKDTLSKTLHKTNRRPSKR